MVVAFGIVSLLIIALEVVTGCALASWTGDQMIVERERSPGPFWFLIALHAFVGIALPVVFLFAQ